MENFCPHCSFQRSLMGWLIDLISHFPAESSSEKTSFPLSVWSIYDINVKSGRWKDRRNLFQCNLSDISESSLSPTSLSSLQKILFKIMKMPSDTYFIDWLVICGCHKFFPHIFLKECIHLWFGAESVSYTPNICCSSVTLVKTCFDRPASFWIIFGWTQMSRPTYQDDSLFLGSSQLAGYDFISLFYI